MELLGPSVGWLFFFSIGYSIWSKDKTHISHLSSFSCYGGCHLNAFLCKEEVDESSSNLSFIKSEIWWVSLPRELPDWQHFCF